MNPTEEQRAAASPPAPIGRRELALLVNDIARSITGTLDLARVFDLTVQKTREFLRAEAASLLLL
ncbi:MAG: hypothetical protein ACK4N5_18510, partial [Myxococcales bacterium]